VSFSNFNREFGAPLCLSKDKNTVYGSQGANVRKSTDDWVTKSTIWSFATNRPLTEQLVISSATGGTFEIGLSADDKVSVAYNVSAEDLQTALRGLTGVADTLTVTSSVAGTYTITHDMADTDNALKIISSSLTGTGASVILTITQYYYLGNASNYVKAISEFDNGDLLVSTVGQGANMPQVFHGTLVEATWKFTPVLTSPGLGVQFDKWGMSTCGCMAMVAEYGTTGAATHAYLSNNYGKVGTWTEILDLLDPTLPITMPRTGVHIHSVAIDAYEAGVLWVTYGDSAKGILRSKDWGHTWELVAEGQQFTSIYPLRDYIILGSDDGRYDQGVYRMNKKTYEIEMGYKIANKTLESGSMYVGGYFYRGPDNESPLYLPFVLESGSDYLYVIGTMDGRDFYAVAKDSRIKTGPDAIDVFLGPTESGKIIMYDRTFKQATANAPGWFEI
jgi:hypothetical protein